MTRWLVVTVPLLCIASCATGEDDVSVKLGGTSDSGPADSGVVVDSTSPPADTSASDTLAADTSIAETSVTDTSMADTFVTDTFVTDTFVADTFVADTFVPDTYVPDTYVPDTYVPDTFVADTAPVDSGSPCSATVVDWNWNTGTGPTAITKSSSTGSWAIGKATVGPADGLNWLATNPGGNYPNSANEWVRLPTLDLSSLATCKIKVTVDLWRNAEKVGFVNYDGGNVQYTTDPAASTGWTLMDGGSMGYDAVLSTDGCSTGCYAYGQKTWTGSGSPNAKTGTFTSSAPLGASLTLRFTFASDSLGALPGIYIKRVRVEAVP